MNTEKDIFDELKKHCRKVYEKYKANKLGKRQRALRLDWLEKEIGKAERKVVDEIKKMNLTYSQTATLEQKVYREIEELEYEYFGILN
jgi:hypothetical protein